MALALVLLIGSALLIRTAVALGRVDPGFDPSNVLTMRMSLSGAASERSEAVEQLIRNGVERPRAIPGVVSASATCFIPLQGGYGLPFVIAGRPLDNGPFHGGRWRSGKQEIGIVDQTLFQQEKRAAQMRASTAERLSSAGWVSQRQQIVHIPITAAMQGA